MCMEGNTETKGGVEKKGIVVKGDERYPKLLAEAGDAPKQLYYRGEWDPKLFRRCLAVVGTRRMTSYGRRMAEQIVEEIAAVGITIVSGFMYGIDAVAHKAALRVKGKTIAVMPCGIDVIHPEFQADLHAEIENGGGLIVSEYEGTHPTATWMFPRRNRIVAGLCQATLVVEAGEKSGALITAECAKRYGRKIFAVPNALTSAVSQGVTQLLREEASIAGNAQDVLKAYGVKFQITNFKSQTNHKLQITNYEYEPESIEGKIIKQLRSESMEIDELTRQLEMPAATIGVALSMLQLGGHITEEGGMYHLK